MPKLSNPLYSDSASGSIHKIVTYTNQWGWDVCRGPAYRQRTSTPPQQTQRSKFTDALIAWRALPDSEKQAWKYITPQPMGAFAYFAHFFLLGIEPP